MNRWAWLFACGALTPPMIAGASAASVAETARPSATVDFTIPAQPLSSALIAFGLQSRIQVLTAGEAIAGHQSPAVQGHLHVDAALALLLEGSGLVFEFVDPTTVVVKPPRTAVLTPPPAASKPAATSLAPVHAMGLFGREGYLSDGTSGPTRLEADLSEIPQSVGVVTRDLMNAQQARTVAEAVRNVAGVQVIDTSSGLPRFQVRGFRAGNGMTNGLPNSIAGIGDLPPLIGVERIEVLKGPQAILGDVSSNNNFGGLINLVLKKPQREPIHNLTYALGRYGDVELGVDLAGALSSDGRLMYRLIASGERADHTAQGYLGPRKQYIAPSLGWKGRDTAWIVGLSRMVNRMPIPDHTLLLGTTLASSSPPGLLLGHRQDHTQFQTSRAYYQFEHAFNPTWLFRSRGQYVRELGNQQSWLFEVLSPSGDLSPVANQHRQADAYYALQNDLVATVEQGRAVHTVVMGWDYSRTRIGRVDDRQAEWDDEAYNLFTSPPLPPVHSRTLASASTTTFNEPWVTDSGLFLQDQIKVGERVDVLLALRRAVYELSIERPDGSTWERRRAHWVPNLGVVYKVVPGLALYASTTSGFQPDSTPGKNGGPLLPALSRQTEVGLKLDLLQDRARLTVSGYRITLDRRTVLSSPTPPYYGIPGPGQTNKGIEVEFKGQVTPGLNVSANYAYAIVRHHDPSPVTGAPRHQLHLWGHYAFQSEGLRGWSVAAGLRARSHAIGLLTDGSTTFRNPGQYSLDANLSYRRAQWSVTLGVQNLLQRRLYGEDFDETFVPLYGQRTLLLSGTFAF
ncbi:TonB-dependent siderophore receptor [Dyella koreensis]|uniref:TonB-dependent receptor n=1 Tax=Dyella koreensis TaxID=311235 RepID=A0ABW8K7X5_9GAMM